MLNWPLTLFARFNPVLKELSGFPYFVFCLVLLLTLLFFAGYLVKGTQVWWQLRRTIRQVKAAGPYADPDVVGKFFAAAPLRHLWAEYRDTLHALRRTENGDAEIRATLPAETYFTKDVLVDGRLFDDFTRHLPGILTGLGIIGTFAGLLQGLGAFDPTSPSTAVAGLKPLLGGVSHAFIASAVAICCAMLVTFVSRLVLAYFYRLVERLNHAIDALYNTGAGEEYLARLVHSSEKSEAHAAQLKDAMVEDLSRMMTNLVERQIEAQANVTAVLGDRIGESIKSTLAAPLQKMTDAMESTSRGNSEAVSGMLESMLTGFMAKLEDTFGGQMRGVNEQMERSLGAISGIQQSLQQLLGDIARTSEHASTQVTQKLEEALANASANQDLMTNQMREFVNEFRQLVTAEHAKSKGAMDETVGKLLEQVSFSLESMAESRAASTQQEQERNDALARRTADAVDGMARQQELMLTQMRDFAHEFKEGAVHQQAAATSAMDASVGKVLEQVSVTLESLANARAQSSQEEQARNETLARRTAEAVGGISSHQEAVVSQVRSLANELRDSSMEQLAATSGAMNTAVDAVLARVSGAVADLQRSRDDAATQDEVRSANLSRQTEEVVSKLAKQLDVLISAVSAQVAKTQSNIDALQSVSIRAIDGMNTGAATMGSAAQRFETAGSSVSGVFERSATLTTDLQRTSQVLQSASLAVEQGFAKYDSTRESVQEYVRTLSDLIEGSKRDVGLSKDILGDLERIVEQLRIAETQAADYLKNINDTLVTTFNDFGTGMQGSVRQTIGETDRHLSSGVQQLNGVVQELSVALQRMKRAA